MEKARTFFKVAGVLMVLFSLGSNSYNALQAQTKTTSDKLKIHTDETKVHPDYQVCTDEAKINRQELNV